MFIPCIYLVYIRYRTHMNVIHLVYVIYTPGVWHFMFTWNLSPCHMSGIYQAYRHHIHAQTVLASLNLVRISWTTSQSASAHYPLHTRGWQAQPKRSGRLWIAWSERSAWRCLHKRVATMCPITHSCKKRLFKSGTKCHTSSILQNYD